VIFYEKKLYRQDGIFEPTSRKVTALPYTEKDLFAFKVQTALNSLWASPTARMIIKTLQKSMEENPYLIIETNAQGEGSRQIATMCYWNYQTPEAIDTEKGKLANAPTNLIHELGHAYRWAIGSNQKDEGQFADSWQSLKLEEEETSHLENQVRADTNAPLRTTYNTVIVSNGKRVLGKGRYKNWDYRKNKGRI
jgi:hypothetical protein